MKLTVVSTYPIFPPRAGGKNRIFYLYRELAKFFKVEIICLTGASQPFFSQEIAPSLLEIRVPKSENHVRKELELEKHAEIPISEIIDLSMLYLYDSTPAYVDAVCKSASTSDFVICSHSFIYPLVAKYLKGKNVVYESHNVEYLLKKDLLPKNEYNKDFIDCLFETENQLCNDAALVSVCSRDDASLMRDIYHLDINKVIEVPNGVDLDSVSFTTPERRSRNKQARGLENNKIAIFIGSYHWPNVEAVQEIAKFAAKLPEVEFFIVGSICSYFKNKQFSSNVKLLGMVSNEEKDELLGYADVALNPMLSGSGTNIKMLDYIAAGIPVISTPIGVRGLFLPDELVEVSDISDFKDKIETTTYDHVFEARKFVEKNYDWKVISKKIIEFYREFN